jgi:hypothetical protein
MEKKGAPTIEKKGHDDDHGEEDVRQPWRRRVTWHRGRSGVVWATSVFALGAPGKK